MSGRGDINRGEPDGHADAERKNRESEEGHRARIGFANERRAACVTPENADADDLDEGRESDRNRQGQAGPGKREDKAAAEVGKMEALKHGLEDEPFADEASRRGHRRE